MLNDYTKKYIKALARIFGEEIDFDKMDKEKLKDILKMSEMNKWIDKIYQDGYEDGGNSTEEEKPKP